MLGNTHNLANSAHSTRNILLDSLNFQDLSGADDTATYTRAYTQHVNHRIKDFTLTPQRGTK